MADSRLIQLAQDLEWLGCELEFYGHKHALEGLPGAGPTWDTFLEKQHGVLTTADKIDRELKNALRFNPARFVDVEYPLEAVLDSLATLLAGVEEIRQAAVFAVHELPTKVRNFTRMVEGYTGKAAAVPE